MNSLRPDFPSLSCANSSAKILSRCAPLLCICLLALTAGNGVAQEARSSEPVDARSGRPSPPGGTITGRVTGEDGRPLPDAVVYFSKAYARLPSQQRTATSDSEGRFKVEGLESGLYFVMARLPGFVNAQEPVPDGNEAPFYRPGDSVNLTLVKGGVITGTVRDANGEPVVGVSVRAIRVRDANGRARPASAFSEMITDDRGIYRLYGLLPGTYVVSAGSSQRFFGEFNPYEGDVPTFFPSSTRDTAAEISVRSGEEATGTDIRYRGERGYSISGTITGSIEESMRYGITISLRQATSGGYEMLTFAGQGMKPSFSFDGLSDGEYELTAQQWGGASDSLATLPRRITVKGGDVTGVELTLARLGSISGRVHLEGTLKENCGDTRNATLLETPINAIRDVKSQAGASSSRLFASASAGLPTEQGEFTIRNLLAGNYRLTARLPVEAWYVRSITLPSAAAARPLNAQTKSAETKSVAAASLITLKTSESVSGVTIQIAQDAASLRGRVVNESEDAPLPPNLKVHLVPVERERAEDVLRYREVSPGSEGAFTLKNLAPGRYWLITRPAQDESAELNVRPLAWDAQERARLRREAEAANTSVELQPCQRAADYTLRHATAK
jgi:protocatechuate 3,4-dioxygenase beta subunit